MYAIVCVPLNTPTVLYLHHHRAASDGWASYSLCDVCLEAFRLILQPSVGKCTYGRSWGCNVCLLQPPWLRGLASHTVFHLTFNLSEFALTSRTLYQQYLYAVESNIAHKDRPVPLTFSRLQCTFVRDKRCAISKQISQWLCNSYWTLLVHNIRDVLC